MSTPSRDSYRMARMATENKGDNAMSVENIDKGVHGVNGESTNADRIGKVLTAAYRLGEACGSACGQNIHDDVGPSLARLVLALSDLASGGGSFHASDIAAGARPIIAGIASYGGADAA